MAADLIMTKLREACMPMHRTLSDLPYVKALMSHQLPLPSYVNALRALAVIHSVLEEEIAEVEDEVVGAVWSEDLKKYPLLQADLKFFAPRAIPDATTALDNAVEVTKRIRLERLANPVAMLGYLYVLEGTTLGNDMHRPDITKTFCLQDLEGYRYYNSYGADVQAHWEGFKQRMNAALPDPAVHEAVVAAAREMFFGLESLYTNLYPLDSAALSVHVTRINPEAGTHPVPETEEEIEAALRASQRGWDAFPYYQARYGERGKRFSDSDTCWLVTLTRLDEESFTRQIQWIARVLASRGMPTIMLEETFRYLEEELTAAVPENAEAYALLTQAADALAQDRLTICSEAEAQTRVAAFETAVASCEEAIPRVGELLVCVIADEANGRENAIASLHHWLMDSERFSETWRAAVRSAIENDTSS